MPEPNVNVTLNINYSNNAINVIYDTFLCRFQTIGKLLEL